MYKTTAFDISSNHIKKVYTFCQSIQTVNDVPNQNTRLISFPFGGIYDAVVEPLQTFAI